MAGKIRQSISVGLFALVGILLFIVFEPMQAAAYTYGSGSYGECVYSGELGGSALTYTVNTSSVNFGTLSASSTSTGTATMDVTMRCSNSGYAVTLNGTTLTSGGDTITALASPAASSAGTEQFGVNLVTNTSPSLGANPSGGSGTAATGYDTANNFKFVSGNTIAQTATYSAQSTFTISFIANISSITEPGAYVSTLTPICTATY